MYSITTELNNEHLDGCLILSLPWSYRIAYELRYVLQWMANADQLLLHRLHGGVEL